MQRADPSFRGVLPDVCVCDLETSTVGAAAAAVVAAAAAAAAVVVVVEQ
jgi:hypothetical protein